MTTEAIAWAAAVFGTLNLVAVVVQVAARVWGTKK